MGEREQSRGVARPTRGEKRAPASLIEKMRRLDRKDWRPSQFREIAIVAEGSEESNYLDAIGANANVGGPWLTHILLREEPRLIEAWEEFIHGTQMRRGIIGRLGVVGSERHVKEFMIRHRRLLGISEDDAAILRALLGGS